MYGVELRPRDDVSPKRFRARFRHNARECSAFDFTLTPGWGISPEGNDSGYASELALCMAGLLGRPTSLTPLRAQEHLALVAEMGLASSPPGEGLEQSDQASSCSL